MVNPPKEIDIISGEIIINIQAKILESKLNDNNENIKSLVKLANHIIDIGSEIFNLQVFILIIRNVNKQMI